MLEQCSPSVRSDGGSASGRSKTMMAACTGLWLCPVGVHRTHPVMIPGDLDLSRIDQTLSGSVRSLPPERLVNRKRAVSGLLPRFLIFFAKSVLAGLK